MKIVSLPNLHRYLRKEWGFGLTRPGKVMIVALLLTGLLTIAPPFYAPTVALTCLLFLSYGMAQLFRPRVDVKGSLPERMVAGRPISIDYELTNRSRLPTYDVSITFSMLPRSIRQAGPVDWLGRLDPAESASLSVVLEPLRRGQYELAGPVVYSTFPFNLFRAAGRKDAHEKLLVLPSFHRLDHLDLPQQQRHQPGGIALASNVGESPEYIGNREYRPGDSPRRIDSRAWARLARPAVREYQQEYYSHVALVLDTYVPGRRRPGARGFAEFEAAVSLSAALADAMSHSEAIIDFFAAGPDLHVFRAGRHTARFESLLEILACVGHCRTNPFDSITPVLANELQNTSAIVFVLLDWDENRERLVRLAVESECAVKVVIVRGREPSVPTGPAESWAGEFVRMNAEQVQRGELTNL